MQLLLCGYEIRRTWKKEVTVYHAQVLGTWKSYTFITKKSPDDSIVGSILEIEEEEMGDYGLRPFFPWRHQQGGMGPVRGYSVTYSPKYGVQAWTFVGVDTDRGPRNLPVLMGSGKPRITGMDDFKTIWQDVQHTMVKEFPMGRYSFIDFSPKINRHIMLDNYEPFTIHTPEEPAPEPAVDTASSDELPASPTG